MGGNSDCSPAVLLVREAIEIPILWHVLYGHEMSAVRGHIKISGEGECYLPEQPADTRAAAAARWGVGRKGKLKLTHN